MTPSERKLPNLFQSMSSARSTSAATLQPARSETSRSRCEFDEFGEPTTIMASTSGATQLDRFLPVGGGVADVVLVRPDDIGEALFQRGRDLGGIIERKRGLRHERELVLVFRNEGLRVGQSFHEPHRAVGQLPERADHFRMPGMADQHDFAVRA